ncbi:MAG: hypothetical protein L3J41_17710 [Melioribacteraceae bacterium]|nr:hypothetical protein [Melioribacteraceae bacterium]
MAIFLSKSSLNNAERELNNSNNYYTVAAVIISLFILSYLLTNVYQTLSLPAPKTIAHEIGVDSKEIFDNQENVKSRFWVLWTKIYDYDEERLMVFIIIAFCFLSIYFVPVKYKRQIMVGWFFVGFYFLYGIATTSGLLLGHLLVYLTFHPDNRESLYISPFFGILFFTAFSDFNQTLFISLIEITLYSIISFALFFVVLKPYLKKESNARIVRMVAIQGPFGFSVCAAILQGFTGSELLLPLGLIIFFLQWERLMVYQSDYNNGQVPKNISFMIYLSVFLSPAVLLNWSYNPYIGQGYSYMNDRFLNKDKNKIVLSGLKLWGFALLYIIIGNTVIQFLVTFFHDSLGIVVYPYVSKLVRLYVQGTPMTTETVLFSTLLDQVRFFLFIASIVHFKVGAWRVFGFDMDPQYNKPWMATNLSNFWTRYAFHFREFLSRIFYYPIFLKFFKNNFTLRLFVAVMASAAFGNLVWGHVPDRLWTKGLTWDGLINKLEAWPYYLLLGLSIFLTDLYLLKRKRKRKPWTFDKWIWTDFISVYLTIQFFALIHVFARPHPDGSLIDYVKLFLLGLGVEI